MYVLIEKCKKIIFELSSIPSLIRSSDVFITMLFRHPKHVYYGNHFWFSIVFVSYYKAHLLWSADIFLFQQLAIHENPDITAL